MAAMHKRVCRLTAAVLCLCMLTSTASTALAASTMPSPSKTAPKAEATEYIIENSRVADPDTMDDYLTRLLSFDNGSRYAGRVWTDKTVFAYGGGKNEDKNVTKAGGESHFDGVDTVKLSMRTDGYTGDVGFDSDFLHVFSTLASSQVVNEYPPSPVDLVLVLDVSSSMGDATEPEGNVFAEIMTELERYFTTGAGAASLKTAMNDPGSAFSTYYNDNKKDSETAEHFAARRTFNHTRFLNLIYSANRVIEQLMENNSENRVSVVIYDRRATVIMPLAHYTANTTPLKDLDNVHGVKEHYYDTEHTSKRGALQIINEKLQDQVFGYLCPFFDGHDSSDGSYGRLDGYVNIDVARVVAKPDDKVAADGETPVKPIDIEHIRLAGTNTHAGLTAGLEQLANAKETTLTATLSNGQTSTVPRIPVAVVMTDGGSNTVANGPWYDPDYATPVQRSDYKNEWSSVVVTQYLLTAAYLKSAVEKNYKDYMALKPGQDLPVYTVGVDLRDDTDDWVPARLYPMMDPSKYFKPEYQVPDVAGNPSSPSGTVDLANDNDDPNEYNDTWKARRSNEGIIANAYSNWEAWKTADDNVTMLFPVLHWGHDDADSTKMITKRRFQQDEKNDYTGCYNNYIIPFEHDAVNLTESANIFGSKDGEVQRQPRG